MSAATHAPTTTAAPRSDGRATRRRRNLGDLPAALVFVLPATIGFVVFLLWPTLRGIWLSFTDTTAFQAGGFIGLENYQRLADDPVFWNAFGVTLWYVVLNIGIQTTLAVLVAVLMHRLTRSMVIRGIILTPYLVSNVVAAMLFLMLLDYQLGFVNEVIAALGWDRVMFFGDQSLVIPTIALVNVWRHVGYTALLVFAGLQTIPGNLYEAGRVDGASELRMFRSITMPLLRPYLGLVLIVTMIGSFQVFDTVSVATQGGPANASNVIQYYIYEVAFSRGYDFGYASAMSVALMVVLATISIVQFRLTRANQNDMA
ncbi:multiple sugar transport system permease protein [Isoptericola sp. CG 20/1183]|uniref:Multiple sugar transport system permease protein n=1 Tax=Isoptericola halotolerans TaxID=300560 RepID=A0ABX5EH79_9MICO|nr:MULTISPECIES: sugar ABC transporter permease [Isoptericola]PRZ08844.1 multiple sugar transport system permease protein [Isoptericola halotolerans]PRZ10709.1 multiple sugar transport system permease protein [Isoptericola sp. CG 20/1183]